MPQRRVSAERDTDAGFFEFVTEPGGVCRVRYNRCNVGKQVQRGDLDAQPRVQIVQQSGGKIRLLSGRVAPEGMNAAATPSAEVVDVRDEASEDQARTGLDLLDVLLGDEDLVLASYLP